MRRRDRPVTGEAFQRIYRELLAKDRPPVGDGTGGIVRRWGGPVPKVVVLGSSHALMYARVVDDACREAGLTVSFLCADGITPWFGNDDANDFSREFDEARRRWLEEWRPDLVLVVHRWDWDDAPDLGRKLRALSDELLPVARRVVLMGQPPVLRIGDATNLREYVAWRASREGALRALGPDANEPRRRRNLSVMEALARRRPGLELLRVDDAFTLPDGSVRYAEGRRFFYADDDHLAQAGAEHVSARLAAALERSCAAQTGKAPRGGRT